jgi:phosphoglycerate dehydrogenase-like enzyme
MNIILLGGIASLGKELLEAHLRCDCNLAVLPDPSCAADYPDLFETADVIVGWPLTPEVAARARKLKLIHVAGAGVDGLRLDLLPPGVLVANTYHHETSMAEYVLMAMLVLIRRPHEYDQRLRRGNWWDSAIWGETPHLSEICGRSVLLLGLGHIAKEVARRARAFGMKTVAVSRTANVPSPEVDLKVGYDVWEQHLGEADFVVPCCPLTPATEGLVAAPQIARMKPSAYLINAARGKIVDEQALYEALRDGRIAGAALDVWYQYPKDPAETCFPSRFPFHELPNVLLSPHVSGWTNRTLEGRMKDIAKNINRLAAGETLFNLVDHEDH